MNKLVVMLPTYNEIGNIEALIQEILAVTPQTITTNILVVDDNSPDGTGQAVTAMMSKSPNVHLLTRYKRRGRGNAGVDGYLKALEMGADLILEMDADFSHAPKHIPAMLEAAQAGNDLVIGSRLVKGGSDNDRGLIRLLITKLAVAYTRMLLNLKTRDVNSGYRLFSRKVLESIDVENLVSTGPSIVCEVLYKTKLKGFKIKEVPIQFVDRRAGSTKLNWIILLEVLFIVLKLRDLNKRGQLLSKTSQPQPSSAPLAH